MGSTDIYKAPNGPSVRLHIQNIMTMEELRFPGNCLKGSRPILSFDSAFDTEPHLQVIKNLMTMVFGVPEGARKSKPFVDHVMGISWVDEKIWIRCKSYYYPANRIRFLKTDTATIRFRGQGGRCRDGGGNRKVGPQGRQDRRRPGGDWPAVDGDPDRHTRRQHVWKQDLGEPKLRLSEPDSCGPEEEEVHSSRLADGAGGRAGGKERRAWPQEQGWKERGEGRAGYQGTVCVIMRFHAVRAYLSLLAGKGPLCFCSFCSGVLNC